MSWASRSKSSQKNDRDRSKSDETIVDPKDNMYDSGRADSGFLSGSNLISDSCLSGEISPPPEPETSRNRPSSSPRKTDSFSRLDSGVDVCLSDQLSGLDIDKCFNDLSCPSSDKQRDSYKHNIPLVEVQKAVRHPWEYYFQQDEEGDTSLHIAVIRGLYSDLLTLVRMIPDPKYLDIRNDMRQTALHLAVLTTNLKMVKLLIACGAKTDSVDHCGNTPLHLAVAAGDLELVRELTQPPPQDRVASAGLLYTPPKQSSRVDPPEINMYNYEGLACIHLALMGGHIALLKHLAWFGANINAGELKGGLTPVHMGAMSGDAGLVSTLVKELGADPCPITYAGQSPYLLAREGGVSTTMASCLVDLGSSCIGDSEDEDEDHLAAHYLTDEESDDEDIQMMERPMRGIRDFQLGVAA